MGNESRKVEKLIAEAEKLESKGKDKKALEKYQKAHEIDPDREGLYDKLIELHKKILDDKEWEMEDFAEHIDMVMHKQEKDFPPIKQTHAKLTPEWKDASNLVFKILETDDDAQAGPMIEELVGKGEIATRVLIDLLRSMKKGIEEGEGEEPQL